MKPSCANWRLMLMAGAGLLAGFRDCDGAIAPPRATRVAIVDGRWHIKGRVTHAGAPAEGLLMNVRMVNAIAEDLNALICPPGFNADTNTAKFIASIPDYAAHGVDAFTVCLQGGMPGYEYALNSAFAVDGTLRPEYMARARSVIEACDQHGLVVILGLYPTSASPRCCGTRRRCAPG